MKKILLLLLLATFSIQAQTLQNPTYGNVKLKNNTTDNSATKVNVQSTDGTINTISKSDLVNVVEVNDVPTLPLVGEVGKIYVVKNVNKIYRWNGTFYQELAGSDISGKEDVANKATDFTTVNNTLYPSVEAVKTELDLKISLSQKATVNGVASLGADGKVPASQLPDNTIIEENFTYSGSQSFILSEIPSNLSVYVNGQYLENTQYTLLDNILTITPILSANYRVQVKSTILGSELSSSRFASYVQKGIMPEKTLQQSPYYIQLAPFITKYFEKNQDVTIVQIGDSFSTNLDYNTTLTDANIRPPLMTEWNLNAQLEEKLRWKEQEYRRFDYPAAFFENLGGGSVSNLSDDYTNWGYNIAGLNLYPELTRVIDGGTNSGVSYGFPAGMKRCNFILHTDLQWADTTEIEISEGNGKVEVFNGTTWVEANGYTFSAKESATLLGTGQQYHRDQYQKRIKMRSLTDLSAKTVTIQNVGTGRFGYWGIEYSTSEFMFTYIAASKGGHGIESLQKFQEWMVDDFDPDLLLQQCAVINEGASTVEAFQTPEAFAAKFETQYDGFISQGYLVFPYITFIGEQAEIVDPITGKFKTSTFAGETITVPDYINKLASMYLSKNAPFVNIFSRILEIAFKIDEIKGNNNIYTSAILGSGKDGNTLTIDSIHPNNYQTEIMTRILFNYFNF